MVKIFASDVSIYSGDSRILDVSVVNKSGIPVDISGSTITWALIKNSVAIVNKSNSTGGIVLNSPTSGEFLINILTSDTTSLSGIYTHEARVIDSGGNSSVVFYGNMTITKSYI